MHFKILAMGQGRYRRVLFYTSLIIAVIFMFKAIKIAVFDLPVLTAYGWGYLVGNSAIAFLSLGFALVNARNR